MNDTWSHSFRYWMLTALVLALAAMVWVARDLVAPLVVAALLAFVLNPTVDFLTRHTRLRRSLAMTIMFILGLGALVGLPISMLPRLVAEILVLAVDLQIIILELQELLSRPVVFLSWEFHFDHLIPDPTRWLVESTAGITESAFHLLEATTRNLLWFLVIVVATYYLLRDWSHLRDWLLELPPQPYRADARRLYQEIKRVWRGYLRGNLALMAIVGVVFTLVWLALGVPGALILGIIAGVLTIIPDLGPAIAAALAVLVALFEGSTYLPLSNIWFAILVTGVYLGLINIKNIWLRPRIFGRSVHMHDGIVFIAIIVAVVVWGILGALIVIPVLASAGILGRYVYQRIQGLPPWPAEAESEALVQTPPETGESAAAES